MGTTTFAPRHILPPSAPRDEWLAARRKGIGSSDIAALLGLTSYASPYSLWVDKVMGLGDDVEPDDGPLYWGRVLEQPVAWHFSRRNNVEVREVGLIGHPDIPWMLATPDREVLDISGNTLGLLEVKTASAFRGHDWEGDDSLDPDGEARAPEVAIVQLQWQLAVRGLDRGWIAGLIGGQRYHQIEYARDDELIETLIDVAGPFWARVESGERPSPDGHPATTAALKELYRDTDDSSVLVDPGVAIPLLLDRQQAKAEEAVAKARAAAAENQLKELLGSHQIAVSDDRPLYTWRAVERTDGITYRRFHVPRGVI
jgi:putative phage-type endonuclease